MTKPTTQAAVEAPAKSATDRSWQGRAETVEHDADLNIQDVSPRERGFELICPHMTAAMRVLEVGRGNGCSTVAFCRFAGHADGFDRPEGMMAPAEPTEGETNNHLLVDNVPDPSAAIAELYDAVISVRVLSSLPK
jgi:hypothetical protein